MKKQFLFFMLFATCALAFTGCKKDDDDVSIQGKWIFAKEVWTQEEGSNKETGTELAENNNSYILIKEGDVVEIWEEGEKQSSGTYLLSADKKTLTVNLSDYSLSLKVITLTTSSLVLEIKEVDGSYKYTAVTTYKRG